VVQWCEIKQNVTHCASLTLLKGKVKQICSERLTPFREGTPGRSWWYWFQKRHPQLVLCRPENLDPARARGLSKEACDKFYRFLTSTCIRKRKYPQCRIWNADESGLSASQTNSNIKVIGIRGSKNVMITNNSNREWMTILVCVNAMAFQIFTFSSQRIGSEKTT